MINNRGTTGFTRIWRVSGEPESVNQIRDNTGQALTATGPRKGTPRHGGIKKGYTCPPGK